MAVRGKVSEVLGGCLVALATLKIGVAFSIGVAHAVAHPEATEPRTLLMLLHVVIFAAVGGFLLVAGRDDARARSLGTVYVLIGVVFADSLRPLVEAALGPGPLLLRGVLTLQPDAFSPLFVWLFVRDFPRATITERFATTLRVAVAASLVVGVALFVGDILWFVAELQAPQPAWASHLALLARGSDRSLYFPVQFVLSGVAMAVLLHRARHAPPDERRRVSLLVWGLVLGTVPTIAWVLAWSAVPRVDDLLPIRRAGWVLYPLLLSVPLTTAYAVLTHHALDVRLIVRRALQYALARYSALALAPAVLLLVSIYRQRDRSIGDVATSTESLLLLSLTAGGLFLLRGRQGMLTRIDRHFFREQYDAQRILKRLVDQCRWAGSPHELAGVLRSEVERSLHPGLCELLLLDTDRDAVASPDGRLPPLPLTSGLVATAGASGGIVEITGGTRGRHPGGADGEWLRQSGVCLLIPLRDDDARIVGLLALGQKRSELPYSSEDLTLLESVASAAEMTIAHFRLLERVPSQLPRVGAADEAGDDAWECGACGAVQAAEGPCVRCGAATGQSLLPRLLRGAFEVHARIGAGGMGVVYRGTDLRLERPVALKTLPYLSPDEARRLHREARAMALAWHPNLAVIHGVEEWRGRPVLVCEYLPRGTLADRLVPGPLPVFEVFDLGARLASALATLHQARVLHRDIKPSNIGFAQDGTPKLLDFGIAHRIGATVGAGAPHGDGESTGPASLLRGTPRYMAPETLAGVPPGPSSDVWSLCVVLYEAATGRHPSEDRGAGEPRGRGDGAMHLRGLPAPCTAFFRRALALDPDARPAGADALARELRELRSIVRGTPGASDTITIELGGHGSSARRSGRTDATM
ncbi:MAG TPA: protein kinase [Gemmatimonadales bacterium]